MALAMRMLATITCALGAARADSAAPFDPYEGPKPIAVFIQTDPWMMVIGSDTPRVAVYDDGEVIFARLSNRHFSYRHTKLSPPDLAGLREHFTPVLSLDALSPQYDLAPNVTDQPKSMFYLRSGDREITTSVYGLMDRTTKLPAYTVFPGAVPRDQVPAELLALHKDLCGLDYADSDEWVPKYIEVMLWGYDYAPEKSIRWPSDWPSLKSNRARQHGDLYSIFLDGSVLPRLREFLATQSEKGAVVVEGKKFAVAYRYVFPNEPIWRAAFRTANGKHAKH